MANKTPNPEPTPTDQSGSTGRPVFDPTNPGKDSGQGRYGQSGLGGNKPANLPGEEKYRKTEKDGDPRTKNESNRGSGRDDADETADIPKTG